MKVDQSILQEDIPRYRKKSRPHSPAKSKHKHDYQPCVFEYKKNAYENIHGFMVQQDKVGELLGTYCTKCGKIGVRDWESMMLPIKLTDEQKMQLDSNTRTIPTFWLDDEVMQKFVELEDKQT